MRACGRRVITEASSLRVLPAVQTGLFLAGILGFFRNRLPLGTIFFAYLFFSGFFVSLAEWLRPEKALFGGINLNFLFGAILIGGGLLGVALPLSFWLKRGRRIKA